MKQIPLLFILALLFSSCKKDPGKDPVTTGPEPRPTVLISKETISSGSKWGVTIGNSANQVYADLQAQKDISYLSVIGNVYTKLEDLESKIPLYESILLDESVGTDRGIQIYFADDKVKSIWTNAGVELSQWPLNFNSSSTISKNNNIESIYAKLVKIKAISSYSNKFERISIFYKDVKKAYDPLMAVSKQWDFIIRVSDTRYYQINLNFTNGVLSSITSSLMEIK